MSQDALDRAVARTTSERGERHARRARACFRAHATWFAIVNVALFAGWLVDRLVTGEQEWWFLGTLLGWGAGLLVHYVLVRPAFRRRD